MSKTTDPAVAYDAARQQVEALEAEYATIDEAIKRAGLAGNDTDLLRAMGRRIALPALIHRAKRDLAPLALAEAEAQFAAVEAERLQLYDVAEAKKAALAAAQQAHNEAIWALQDCDARRHELFKQRSRAQRQVELFEQGRDALPTPEERGVVVRSVWQQTAVVK